MELKPCPFCGGEAHFTVSSDGYGVECHNERCLRTIMDEHPDKKYAAIAWNTRAERTCKMRWSQFKRIKGHLSYCECSECNRRYSSAFFPEVGEYCMNCGARVVGNE